MLTIGIIDEHLQKLHQTLSDPTAKEEDFEFDIVSPSDKTYEFDVAQSEINYKFYSPKREGHFAKVLDGDQTLWEKQGEKGCNGVKVYRKDGEVVLAALSLNGEPLKHFKKVDGEWTTVKKEDFDTSLEDLKDKPENEADPTDAVVTE